MSCKANMVDQRGLWTSPTISEPSRVCGATLGLFRWLSPIRAVESITKLLKHSYFDSPYAGPGKFIVPIGLPPKKYLTLDWPSLMKWIIFVSSYIENVHIWKGLKLLWYPIKKKLNQRRTKWLGSQPLIPFHRHKSKEED